MNIVDYELKGAAGEHMDIFSDGYFKLSIKGRLSLSSMYPQKQ